MTFLRFLEAKRESRDSRIFTVPPVTGPVKSQHTSLQPARLQAGLQPQRQSQRCCFRSVPQPRITQRSTSAHVSAPPFARTGRETEVCKSGQRPSAGAKILRTINVLKEVSLLGSSKATKTQRNQIPQLI